MPRLNSMNLEKIIIRNAAFLFAVFGVFTAWGFWPYYSDLRNPPYPMTVVTHRHAFLMSIWVVILVIQPLLVRLNKRPLHKLVGKSCYVLVPLILISGVLATHRSTGTLEPSNDFYYHAYLHSILTLVAFGVLFALAIKNRSNVALHSRYMICTIFPLFSPVLSRILMNHFGFLAPVLPTLSGNPLWQVFAFVLADAMLVTFAIVDFRFSNRRDAFPIALGVMLLFHFSDFTLYRIPLIRSFVDFVMS